MAISRIGGTTGQAINGGSITLTLPGGMAVDDLIIVALGAGDDDFTQPTLAMTTAGYTELTASTLSADGGTAGDANLAVFYKFHNGSDTTAVTTASGAGSDSSTAACLQVFRGVATVAQGGPLEIAIATATGTSGGDPNPPSVSGFTEATSAVVIAGMVGNAAALTLTAPTNYTTNALNAVGNDTFDASVGLAYRLTGAADPEDPGVFTDSGAGAAWAAATMVLKEAAPTVFERAVAIDATVLIASSGVVEPGGPPVHTRSASMDMTVGIASAATFFSTLERAAALGIGLNVESVGQRDLIRAASLGIVVGVATSGTVSPLPKRYFLIRRASDPAVSYYTAATAADLPTTGVAAGSLGYAANDNTLHVFSGSVWS